MAHDDARMQMLQHQTEMHPFCFVCSGSNPMGLALRFEPQSDGSVQTVFYGNSTLEGYSGLLHGGMIAALLDGCMTHCLFARGIRGVTAELKVRYLQPVMASAEVQVRAWLENESHGLFQLRAELRQSGNIKASATGKFLIPHD